MDVSYVSLGEALVVAPVGRVDEASWEEFGAHLREGIERASSGALGTLVIDLSGIDYMSSRGLRALTVAKQEGIAAGVSIRYFDHHFAGDIPAHAGLDAHIDLSPNVCTSLLVDKYLDGRHRAWAITGAYGDSLTAEADALARAAGIAPKAAERLKALGIAINYNAYGETITDLHVPPVELAAEMLPFSDPLAFADQSAACKRLADGFKDDMELAKRLTPARAVPGAVVFMLPDAAWARRASGTLANDKAKAHGGSAVAIVSPKTDGGFLVSVRVPKDFSVSAETFCRRFPTGGGRKTAAGINHLPSEELETFATAFEQQFRAGAST